MNNNTKLTMMTILTAGILMSSFMLANTNPTFAKKNKQCDETETFCQPTAKNIKNTFQEKRAKMEPKVTVSRAKMEPKAKTVLMV